MPSSKDFTTSVNLDDFSQDVARVEDLSDRVRLAGYGLAAPLVEARAAQMKREVARTAKRKGKGHPEVALRQGNAERAEARFALFAEELDRSRISRPEFDVEQGAAIWGRVVDDGEPQAGLSVSAIGDRVRLDFDCTDEVGSFALELPATTALVLSVRNKDGAELYRDLEPAELKIGEVRYREIDLTSGAETPCPEPGPDVPPEETLKMLSLVGRTEAAARSLLTKLGLKLGKRSTVPDEEMVGLIVSHVPKEGATVKRGDSVDIVVGASTQVPVPDLIGLTLKHARARLKDAGLVQGELTRVPVRKERAGLIVEQSPMHPAKVDPGRAVNMWIGVAEDDGRTPERPGIDRKVAQIAEMVQTDLIEREVLPADEPRGAFAERLEKAGVKTIDDVDELLTMDRHELRDLLGLRTLAQTDQAIRALKRVRKQVGG